MPRSRRRTPLALALLALCVASAPSVADAKTSKGPPARAVKSDVKFVRCQVCEEVAKTLAREAAKLRGSKGAKLEESDVLEMVEKACDPETETGEWLLKHDLVEKGSALKMQFMGEDAFGKCGQECKTMQLACEKIVADRDTDVAEAVFVNGATFEGTFATDYLCRNDDEDALGACLAKPPKLPKDRPKGPAFEKVDKKDVDMQRMMKTMRDAGMGGMQMYGRDDMEDMMDDYNDDFDASAFEAAKTGSDVFARRRRRRRARVGLGRGRRPGRRREARGRGRERVARRQGLVRRRVRRRRIIRGRRGEDANARRRIPDAREAIDDERRRRRIFRGRDRRDRERRERERREGGALGRAFVFSLGKGVSSGVRFGTRSRRGTPNDGCSEVLHFRRRANAPRPIHPPLPPPSPLGALLSFGSLTGGTGWLCS